MGLLGGHEVGDLRFGVLGRQIAPRPFVYSTNELPSADLLTIAPEAGRAAAVEVALDAVDCLLRHRRVLVRRDTLRPIVLPLATLVKPLLPVAEVR